MKYLSIVMLLLSWFSKSHAQSYGITESSLILNINNAGNSTYDLQASTANPDFNGLNLGTFTSSQSIILAGGKQKTYKCNGCGISGSTLYYRVYQIYTLPGSFTSVNLPFLSNDTGGCGGNQTWRLTNNTTNILDGLSSGIYYLEIYSAADYNNCGTGYITANNNGLFYKATFTVNGIIVQYAGTNTAATTTALGTTNSNVTISNGTITNLCTSPINIMRVPNGAFNQTTPTNYIQFTVKPQPGYQFTVNSIKIDARKMPGGPANGRIDYNPNNAGFVTGNNFTTSTTSTTCTSTVPQQSVNPGGLVISDTTNGLIIRVYFWVNISSNSPLDYSNLSVEGIVSEVNGPPKLMLPTVGTIGSNSAVLGANLVSASGSVVTSRGTVFKTSPGVTISDNQLPEGGTAFGTFSHTRSSLAAQTLYYYAGYATNSFGVGLSPESSFRTKSKSPLNAANSLVAAPLSFSSVNLTWSDASFPATGAAKYGYLVIYSTGTPVIIANPSGLPPLSIIANGSIAAIIESAAPTVPASSAIANGLTGNTLYNFIVIPFTWNGTNTETYNYYTSNIPSVTATTFHTNYLWTGTGTGSWNLASNWQPNGVPSNQDAVTFNNAGTVNVTNVPEVSLTSLTVSGNSIVTLSPPASGGNRNITLNNTVALNISTGATLAVNGNGTNNLAITFSGTGNSANIDGTLCLKQATSGSGSYNSTNCTTNVNGILIKESDAVITSNSGNLYFNGGRKLQLAGSGLIIPNATWRSGSTCEIAVTQGGILSGLGQAFSNFKVNCPALQNNIQCNGNLVTVNDTLNILNTNLASGKKFALTNTQPYTLNLYGDIIISNNACLDITSGSPYTTGIPTINLFGDLTINGTGLLDQSGSAEALLNFTKSTGEQIVSLASSASVSQTEFAATISIGNGTTTNAVKLVSDVSLGNYYISNVNVNNGSTLDFSSYVLSGLGGNINVMPGSILRIGHPNGISTAALSGNVQLTGNRIYSPDAVYNYSGNVNQFTGDGLPVSVNSIIIENTGSAGNNTVSLTQPDSAASITLASGLFNPNGNTQTIKLNGILSARGGDFNPLSTGKVVFSSGYISGTISCYPIIAIKGAVDFGSGSTIYNTLQIDNGGIISVNPPVFAAGSVLKYNTGTSFSRGLEWSALNGAGYPYNVLIQNNTSLDLSANGTSNRACGGYLNIESGSSITMGTMNYPLTVGTDVVISGSLSLSTGANPNGNIYLGGNWTRNTNGVFTPNNRTVNLAGNVSSNINGSSTSASFDYLVINKTSGATVTINKDLTILKGLTLISGIINTNANKVILSQAAPVTRTSGHINGNLQKYFGVGTSITKNFEVGDANYYAPVLAKLNNISTAGNLIISTKPGDHPNISSTNFYDARTINRYWTITNSGIVFGNANPTFSYDAADIDPGVINDSIICARYDNASWSYPNMGVKTSTSSKVLNLTALGDFQLGSRCTSPVLSKLKTDVSCRFGNNGSIQLSESGGAPPFNYLWSNGITTKTFSNIASGTYTVTVTGQGGCSSTISAVITQPATSVTVAASNNSPLCAGSTINLTGNGNGGTGSLTFFWTGPNGFSSTLTSPVINNAMANATGIYQITATDANNCTATAATSVTVNSVNPSISGPVTFCAGSSTTLSTGTFVSYLWSNGATTSSITVNTANTYTVTVTAINGCTGTTSVTVTAIPVLTPSISISANTGVNICTGNNVTFSSSVTNGGSSPVYQWKKNNIVVGNNSPFYNDAGINNGDVIKCLVSCVCATQIPVTSNLLNMVVSQPVPVSAGTGQQIICGTGTATVYGKINNATSGYSGTWSTTSGSGSFSSTSWNGVNGITYTATVNDTGKTIYLVLTGPSSGACAAVKDSVAIDVRSEVSLIPGTINSVCYGASSFTIPFTNPKGGPIEYTLIASSPNPMPGFVNHVSQVLNPNSITASIPAGTQAGVYNFTLQVSKPPCQSIIYNLQLTINPNPAIVVTSQPTSVCLGSSAVLTASGGAGYSWVPGFLDGSSVIVTPSTATTYTVTGTSALGCTSSSTVTIGVNPIPSPVINGNSSVCSGMSSTLNAGSGYNSYLWSNGSTGQTINVNSTNAYTVTVTNANNCSTSVSKNISVLPAIIVSASSNLDSIHAGDTIQLNSTASGSVSGINYDVASIPFAPLSSTGTKVNLGDDQMSGALPIGFSFVFYGNTYSNFYISSNGFITFNAGSNDGCCQGPPIPNNNNGNVSNIISLAWNDLNASGGNVDYFTTGTAPNRKLVVRFNISHINGDPVNTQAILYEGTNYIEIHSTSIPNMLYADPSYISTMGVENDGGTSATTVPGRNGTGWSAINDAWKFMPYATYGYSWTPASGLINSTIKNPKAVPLSSTTYTVTATAYNGCTGTASKFIYVDQPSNLTAFSSATAINCNGSTSNVTVVAAGGVPPYTGTGTYVVSAGTHSFTVTDAIGTSVVTSINIGQPPLLTAVSSSTIINCFGGSSTVTVNATGGTSPYSGTGTFSVTAGSYTYIVSDALGCTSTTNINVSQPNILSSNATASEINCFGTLSSVLVSATGGTLPYSGTGAFNVGAGSYNYIVTDARGCTSSTSLNISQPPALVAGSYAFTTVCYGDSSTVTVTATGGTPPYTGLGNYIVAPGTYTFVVADSKGCTSSTVITINQLPKLISTLDLLVNETCYGQNIGKITITAGNGSSPYTYLWSNGKTGKSISWVPAGVYSVNIVDNNGCSIDTSYTITEPDDILITSIASNISCYNGSNGSVNTSVTGGITPYSYIWNNGATTTGINNLTAGTYKVTVTDANGCSAVSTNILTQASQLISTGSDSDVSCNGGNNGSAAVIPSGGVAPYSYLWNNGATTNSVSNLTAQVYTVTITDANGCNRIRNYTIAEPPALVVTCTQNSVTCYGDNNGKAISNPAGGTPPYLYQWSNGVTSKTAYSLTAGTYTVTVTDDHGCINSSNVNVTQPPQLALSFSGTNINCNGGSNGSINAIASGGTGIYSYLWNNSTTANSLTGLTAGNYTLTVTDTNSCKITSSYSLTQPSILTATLTVTNVSCNGFANGSAVISVSGATPPYSYLWNNGSTVNSLSNLSPGNITVTVTDMKGCSTIKSTSISQPALLMVPISQVNINCNGYSNGFVSANPAGGNTPYSYLWNTGATTKSLYSLPAGTYTVTTTDNKGCTKISNATLTQPAQLNSVLSATNVNCNGNNNGSITISTSGGVTPYSYLWSSGSTQSSVNSLSPGNYTVTVTDYNGCNNLKSVAISEPALLVLSNSLIHLTCNGSGDGKITANPTGGVSPYTYLWSNGVTTKTASALSAGNYTVTVTDTKGCIKTASSILTQPSVVTVNPAITNVSCNGGTNGAILNTVTGGTIPYTYLWNGGSTSMSRTGLSAGNYTVTVTDANGCTFKITNAVTQPAVLTVTGTSNNITCYGAGNGNASAASTGGTTPYTYLWNTLASTSTLNNLTQGTYTVTVTDNKGCIAGKSYSIIEPAVLGLSISTVNSTCNGANNSSVTANPTGGNTPFNYQWNNGVSTKTANNLAPGNYTVTVTDNKGCIVSGSAATTEPTLMSFTINTLKNVSCNGGTNGKIDLSISGGTLPYTNLWSNGATTKIISSLTADVYTITTTDNKGCIKSQSFTITEPVALNVSINKSNPTGGNSNGSATANATGGTAPYSYSWATSPAKSTATISGLSPGVYSVTVTDFNGCTQINSTTLVASRLAQTNNSADAFSIMALPNPNEGEFILKVNSIVDGVAEVILADATSRTVLSQKTRVNSGENKIPLNVRYLSKGIYYLKVRSCNNSKIIQLIVQ